MKFIAQSIKIGELLHDKKIYVVPIFQRNFSWNEQVIDFWNDLFDIYRNDLEEYFLGSMVFTQHEEGNKVKILDGQQRLATLLILLAALRDVLNEIGGEKVAKRIEAINRVLYITDPVTLQEGLKLELNIEDKSFFEKLILQGIVSDTKDTKFYVREYTSHKLMKKAYEFFKEQIRENIRKEGDKFIERILDCIFNRLVIIKIWVSSEVDANIIFETLNDRGLELNIADLVKNYLFSLAKKIGHLDICIQRWKEIVDNVGDYNVSKFLRHYWISNFELIKKEEVYKKLKGRVNLNNVKNFFEELSEEALIYSNLNFPSHEFWNDIKIEKLLEELNILRVEQPYVLLLAAYRRFYKREKEKFELLLRKIINFTFQWSTICELNPNEMERMYSQLAIKLRKGEIDAEDIIEELRKRLPKEEIFEKNFKEKEIKNSKLAKYILLKINNYLLKENGKKELTTDVERINLEHIIPKKPDEKWLNFFKERNIENWRELVYKIGNMTILEKGYNQKIANKFFTEKKKMYEKSILPLNEKLKIYEEFGPSQIEERSNEMVEIAKKIWKV